MKSLKWTFIAFIVLAILAPSSALAHTGLKSSVPQNKQSVTEEVNEISMTFNTSIEKASGFQVTDEQGVEYKIAEKSVNKSTMTGQLEQALPNGLYTVEWKIIGEDGHPIKGTFEFTVDVAQAENPSPSPTESAASPSPSAAESPSSSTQASASAEASATPSASATTGTESDSDSEGGSSLETKSKVSDMLLIAAGALFVLILVLYFKKKK